MKRFNEIRRQLNEVIGTSVGGGAISGISTDARATGTSTTTPNTNAAKANAAKSGVKLATGVPTVNTAASATKVSAAASPATPNSPAALGGSPTLQDKLNDPNMVSPDLLKVLRGWISTDAEIGGIDDIGSDAGENDDEKDKKRK